MGNEGQQPPLPEQGGSQKQGYYGWQYEQGGDEEIQQHSPIIPPGALRLPSPPPASPPAGSPVPPQNYAPPPPERRVRQPNLPSNYQDHIHDMGMTLGYGQGMEYQYFDAPQPTQPIARLRQERLQQLREERMRRQQRRMQPDVTVLIPWRKGQKRPVAGAIPPADAPPRMPESSPRPPMAPPPTPVTTSTPPPSQMSPFISLPARKSVDGQAEISPSLAAGRIPQPAPTLQPAAAPAQDTGMLQKVRIGRASYILMGAFVASRILGLLRTSMFAFVFGTTSFSDAYLQAFLIPDLIFNIVAGGALASAFIPIFTKYMVADSDEKSAWHIASSALNLTLSIMVGLALFAILLAPWLVPIYNPGIHDPKQLDLIVGLTRIMLLQSIALGVGVIVNGILNARQNFLLPAVGTVTYNFGLILGLAPGLFLAIVGNRTAYSAVYAATWGVVLGALLQVGVQIPGLFKVGMKYTPSFDWRHPGVIQIGRQMVPRIINAAMLYVSIFVDRGLIQLMIGTSSDIQGLITQYYQALQLVILPLGIFGQAVSTAAFPTLAENVAKGRFDRVRNTILETLRGILSMSIPSSIGLIVLGFPIIQALLQHGRYSLTMAESTAVPLGFFALGLAGMSSVEILTRSFYAMRDSKTPVIISVGQFVFKIALSLLLINVSVWGTQWGMGALAFSTSLANILEAVVLLWLLNQRVGELLPKALGTFVGRVIIASVVMGVALLIGRFLIDRIFGVVAMIPVLGFLDTTRTPSLGLLGTITAMIKLLLEMFVGVFFYLRAARFLGIEELGPLKRVLDRLKLSWI